MSNLDALIDITNAELSKLEKQRQENSLEDQEDILSEPEEGDLLKIVLSSGISLTSVILSELDDSFLVALPVVLKKLEPKEDDTAVRYSAAPYSNCRSARFMKATVASLVMLEEEELSAYITYLQHRAPERFPGLLEKIGLHSDPQPLNTDPKSDAEVEEFAERLEDLLSKGSIIDGNETHH